MASRYISHRYGSSSSTSHTSSSSSTSRSRERSVLNDQIGAGMSSQLRDTQAFYSSSSKQLIAKVEVQSQQKRDASNPTQWIDRLLSGTAEENNPRARPTVHRLCHFDSTLRIYSRHQQPLQQRKPDAAEGSVSGAGSRPLGQKEPWRPSCKPWYCLQDARLVKLFESGFNDFKRGTWEETLAQPDWSKQEVLWQSDAPSDSVSSKHSPIVSRAATSPIKIKIQNCVQGKHSPIVERLSPKNIKIQDCVQGKLAGNVRSCNSPCERDIIWKSNRLQIRSSSSSANQENHKWKVH